MNKFVFLSDEFYRYHREQKHTEIEQKADRPLMIFNMQFLCDRMFCDRAQSRLAAYQGNYLTIGI